MHTKGFLLGHVVVHNAEDTFFHLAGVGAAQYYLLLRCEVNIYSVLAPNVFNLVVGAELASVNNCEIGAGLEVLFDLLVGSSDQHLFHEQRMVGSSADDTCLNLEFGIPTSVLVNHKDLQFVNHDISLLFCAY